MRTTSKKQTVQILGVRLNFKSILAKFTKTCFVSALAITTLSPQSSLFAQFPPVSNPNTNSPSQNQSPFPSSSQQQPQQQQNPPGLLPNQIGQQPQAKPNGQPIQGANGSFDQTGQLRKDNGYPVIRPEISLIRRENPIPMGFVEVVLRDNQWNVLAGSTLFVNTGNDWKTAEAVGNVLRASQFGDKARLNKSDYLNITWETLGKARPVIGYSLEKNAPIRTIRAINTNSIPVNLESVRIDQVRNVWVVRDNNSILLNFGEERVEAEQAVAVIKRYSFNQIGYVGPVDSPVMRYFFTEKVDTSKQMVKNNTALDNLLQESSLDRTGIEVPGVGLVGVKTNIDATKLIVRKDAGEFVLVAGTEIIANFKHDEWSANDALRLLKTYYKPTAIVRVGNPGIQFFLQDDRVPNRLPFGTVGNEFKRDRLSVITTVDNKYKVVDMLGQEIVKCKSKSDCETIIRTIEHFGLNRMCKIGQTDQNSLRFLAKSE
jgi:hypothetical protein